MENLVLYRKYRPMSFNEVVGQEHIVKTITYAIGQGKPAHAYLFSGMRGVGKTTIARLIAKAVNCEKKNKSFEPCNRCGSCLEVNRGNAIDILELDAASHRGIDEARSLIESIKYPPTRLRYKVFIIDEVHMLTKEAFNALLKTLEEPPSYAIFILATTEAYKVPLTIASRCQRFDFKMLSFSQIEARLKNLLKKEKIEIDKESLCFIAKNAQGSLRDAESLLEQIISQGKKKIIWEDLEEALGIVSPEILRDFVSLLLGQNKKGLLSLIEKVLLRGKDLEQFTVQIVEYLRMMILSKSVPDLLENHNLSKEDIEEIKKLAQDFSEEVLLKLTYIFSRAKLDSHKYPLSQMALELAAIEGINTLKEKV